MHKLVIKPRFRFFRFWEKISIFDFEYGNRPSLELTTFTRHQHRLSDDLQISEAENLIFPFSI